MTNDASSVQVRKWHGGFSTMEADELSIEEPLEIRVRGRAICVTMRTPGHDDELAAGFLLSEGVIRGATDILSATHCDQNEHGNVLNVTLSPLVAVDFARLSRHVFGSSSCGVCGRATIDGLCDWLPAIQSDLCVDGDTLMQLPAMMQAQQSTFHRTGGLHAAALFDRFGRLIVLREDVGRHNAVDKVIGHCLLNGPFPLNHHILLVSGRSSFEIVQKASSARIPIIAAISAPSSLAVDLASRSGQTLIGFLRDRRMNVYTHGDRIEGMPSPAEH